MTKNRNFQTKCVAFANQKGGATKTTTVVNLAAALGEMGKRVLVWDLDVNCGSTRLFGLPAGVNIYGTYEVMTGDESAEDVIIQPGQIDSMNLPENVDLIPGHLKLEDVESICKEKAGPFASLNQILAEPVASLGGRYDYVFFDTSPSMNLPTKAAHMAAQYFVLTAIPESLAIEGLVNAITYIKHARKGGNPNLRLMGVVMNQVPGKLTRLSRALIAKAEKHFNAGEDEFRRLFETHINSSTIVPTVQDAGISLFEAHPEHKITMQYRELAREFDARFERLDESGREMPVEAGAMNRSLEVANG